MEPGPSTVRPDSAPDELAERLRSRDLRSALVTTPDGVLIGIVRRDDLDHGTGPTSRDVT
jgi:Mg/Co/Ni transporter MgtE